jgi:hypothetical protein
MPRGRRGGGLERQFNRAGDGTVLAPGEYLEAVGVRR